LNSEVLSADAKVGAWPANRTARETRTATTVIPVRPRSATSTTVGSVRREKRQIATRLAAVPPAAVRVVQPDAEPAGGVPGLALAESAWRNPWAP
jgi:hypothetical protein